MRPTDELMELFKKCHSVEVNLSIDAYGDLNDFLRTGSKWDEVEKNLKWFYDNFEKIRIHSTITIYNVNCYDKLIDYIKINFPRINHDFMMVFELEWMKVSNLPDSAKIKVKEKNMEFKEKYNLPITDFILKDLNSKGDLNLFLTMDKKLNDIDLEKRITDICLERETQDIETKDDAIKNLLDNEHELNINDIYEFTKQKYGYENTNIINNEIGTADLLHFDKYGSYELLNNINNALKTNAFDFKLLDYTADRYIIDAVEGQTSDKYLVFKNDRITV
jgi:sulfatase maturation enzyme AslB (radical SAM superfamily)